MINGAHKSFNFRKYANQYLGAFAYRFKRRVNLKALLRDLLGHESTTTTHRYVEADLAMKEKALARLEAPVTKMGRYKAPDSLLRFRQTL